MISGAMYSQEDPSGRKSARARYESKSQHQHFSTQPRRLSTRSRQERARRHKRNRQAKNNNNERQDKKKTMMHRLTKGRDRKHQRAQDPCCAAVRAGRKETRWRQYVVDWTRDEEHRKKKDVHAGDAPRERQDDQERPMRHPRAKKHQRRAATNQQVTTQRHVAHGDGSALVGARCVVCGVVYARERQRAASCVTTTRSMEQARSRPSRHDCGVL